jgi:hypothetical protein
MLNFIISTISFSLAAYALDRHFNAQATDGNHSRRLLVFCVATIVSIVAGWAVDKLDGDTDVPGKSVSVVDVVKSGDPIQIAKLLVGIN